MSDDLEKIERGEQATKFIQSNLGTELMVASEKDKISAIEAFLKLDPYSIFELGELQSKIAGIKQEYITASRVGAYLNNFIVEGDNTLDIVNQDQEEY